MAKSKKVCIVSKDILGAKMSLPVAEKLVSAGFEVRCIVEGKAAEMFAKTSLLLSANTGPTTSCSYSYVEQHLRTMSPDVVIVTYGSPINLEDAYARAANALGIPVIGLEDYWACHRRTSARSDCILAVDEFGAQLARQSFPDAQVRVVGNPAVGDKLKISTSFGHVLGALRSKFGNIFMYADNGPGSAEEQLKLLVACLLRTESYCLIPRFHPKWIAESPDGGATYGERWGRILEPLGERVQYVESDRSDPIAAIADITISGTSSLMTTAIYHGRQAVSLKTPGTVELIETETNGVLHRSPLADRGLVHECITPISFDELLCNKKQTGPQHVQPFDVKVSVKAILEFMEW